MILLAKQQVEPKMYIYNLIADICRPNTIYYLVTLGVMPKIYVEQSTIEEGTVSDYLTLFNNETLENIDYDLLLFNFMKLNQNIADISYLNCIYKILTKLPYNAEYHLKLAKILENSTKNCFGTLERVLDFFLENYSNNFESFLTIRPDILDLFNYYKVQIFYHISKDIETAFKQHRAEILSDIRNIKISNMAWCIEVHKITEEERIKILNCWAQNNQVAAFDTYFEYFTSDNLDYENVGKILDEEFKNKMAEEPDIPLNRTRKKNETKINIPGLKSHGKGLMDFN